METKKNFFNYIKNSYSNTTNFANFKISKIFYMLVLLLTILFIPTVNAEALELPPGFTYTAPELPFDLIEDKYYVIIGKSLTGYEELYVSDTPFFMVRGDDKTQINDVKGNVFMWSKMYLSVEDGKYNLNYDRYEYKNNEWILGKKATENLGNQIDIVCFYDYYLYGGAEYLTNHDINGNFNFEGTNIGFFKNDEWVKYPVEEPPVEEPPVEETPIVGNESYIIINGEKVSVNYAIVQYLMRIEFIITLLFTVTVVFFIINKEYNSYSK